MSEVKSMVLYPTPTDAEAFDREYAEEHAPMVNQKIANLSRWTASKVVGSPTGDKPPFHLVAELYFPSVEALQEALGSKAYRRRRRTPSRSRPGGHRFCWLPKKSPPLPSG